MRSLKRARSRANRIFVLLAALGTGSPGGTAAAESELDWVTFGSLEAGTSTFSTSGFKLAPKESGPALLVSVGQGGRRERVRTLEGGTVEIGRTIGAAAAVFGYQWYRADGVIGLFAGPEAALTTLSDGEDLLRRTMRTGLRIQGEAWLRPTDETLFQASIVAGTARTSVWARVAGGYRCEETYVGPEAGLYADATGYRKWFFGLHVTDLEVLGLHLRVSAGGQVTPERGLRPYLGLVTWRAW